VSADAPTLRAFVGLRPPAELAEELVAACAGLGTGTRVAHPADVHLTLHFLGDVPAARLGALEQALAECVRGVGPLALECGRGPDFPGELRPGIAWAGVRDRGPTDALAELRLCTARALDALGLLREPVEGAAARPWVPHLTLARPERDRRPGAAAARVLVPRRAWTADAVLVWRSRAGGGAGAEEQRAGASRYAVLARIPLIRTPA
jgi:2'-5' RNA ligase